VSYALAESLAPRPEIAGWIAAMEARSLVQRRGILRELHANKKLTMPRFLYRFQSLRRVAGEDTALAERSVERLAIPIVHSLLRLESPESFNDPFDMGAAFDVSGTETEKRARFREIFERNNPQGAPHELEAFVAQMLSVPREEMVSRIRESFGRMRRQHGVVCFAGGDNPARNVLMWSHYASEHSGVCLQFDPARDLRVFHLALSIKYCEMYPLITWIGNFHRSIGESLLRKHPRWEYEHEHRITIPEQAERHLPFRPEALTGIILGCRAKRDVEETVRDLLSERATRGMPPVHLYFARQNSARYELDIRSR